MEKLWKKPWIIQLNNTKTLPSWVILKLDQENKKKIQKIVYYTLQNKFLAKEKLANALHY